MSWLDFVRERVLCEAITYCVAGIGVLSVWVGSSRLHWFLRVSVIGVAILGLLPIRAYEPALLFLVVSPAIALSMVMIRRWGRSAFAFHTSTAAARSLSCRVIAVSYPVIALYLVLAIHQPSGYSTRPSWYERLAFGAIVLGLGVVTVLLFRTPRSTDPTALIEPCQAESRQRFRFRVLDALLGFVVVGATSATVAWITRKPLLVNWSGMLGTAACVTLVSVMAACFVIGRRGWSLVAIGLGLSVLGSTALHTWVLSDWTSVSASVWLAPDSALRFKVFLFTFSLLAVAVMVATYLLLMGAAFGERALDIRSPDRVVCSARIAFVCVGVAVYGPLAIVYCGMIAEFAVPKYQLPDTNAYPQVLEIARELYRQNPQESTIEEIRRIRTDAARADAVSQAYRELFDALQHPGYFPMDMERDSRDDFVSQYVQEATVLRSVAQSLDNESRGLETAGRFNEIAENGIATLRLGAYEQRGGVILNSLVGMAVEGMGVHQLSRNRDRISLEVVGDLILALEAVDRSREPTDVTAAREAVWADRAYTWRNSLSREAPVVLAGVQRNEFSVSPQAVASVNAFVGAARRRDAMLRLLITELAIRVFEADHGRLPESLDELCAGYLSRVPIDPYSAAPLVFRRANQRHVLYSVWANMKDDGGRFGTPANEYGPEGFDLDLDVNDRSVAPMAGQTGAAQG